MMAEASIPVDLFNPGQVFACLGFLEAADILVGKAVGGFDWRDPGRVRFHLRAQGSAGAFASVLGFLARARVYAMAPASSGNATTKWAVATARVSPDDPFPFADPPSPAALPAVLECPSTGARLVIDHWGDTTRGDAV
jgi:CRISPR-associated protein Csx14